MTVPLELLEIVALAAAGAGLGWLCARLRSRGWLLAYALPLFVLLLIGVSWWNPALRFRPPLVWLMAGSRERVVAALALPLMLAGVALRLPRKKDQRAVLLFIPLAVLKFSLWPAISPTLAVHELSRVETRIDADGVCRQSTSYTCGPAAAVTVLRRFGLVAREGELALACGTSEATGTEPDVLAAVLNERFRDAGLRCKVAVFDSVEQLRLAAPCVLLVRFNFWADHYVAVLEAHSDVATIADPLVGKSTIPLGQLAREWRRVGVLMRRE